MNLIDSKPVNDETIKYRAHRHWAILLGPTLVMLIGVLSLRSQGYHAMALTAFGFLWGISSYISLQRSEIILTQDRVLINVGFPIKRSHDVPLNELTFIDFYQPSLGSMLNFGKIIIAAKEKRRCVVRFISGPAELVKEVQQQIIALRQSSTKTE